VGWRSIEGRRKEKEVRAKGRGRRGKSGAKRESEQDWAKGGVSGRKNSLSRITDDQGKTGITQQYTSL